MGSTGAARIEPTRPFKGLGSVIVLRNLMDQLAVELPERSEEPVAQLHGTGDDRVEDRLSVALRLADNAQDLAGGGLLIQSRGQVTVTSLELLEQSDVLDGDDRLVGEGLKQRDVLIGEQADHRTP